MRSLAADVLARAGRQVRVTAEPMPAGDQHHASRATPGIPAKIRAVGQRQKRSTNPYYGVHYLATKNLYRARPRDGRRPVDLGSFTTAERAALAVRLYLLWRDRGHSDIPRPPYGKY